MDSFVTFSSLLLIFLPKRLIQFPVVSPILFQFCFIPLHNVFFVLVICPFIPIAETELFPSFSQLLLRRFLWQFFCTIPILFRLILCHKDMNQGKLENRNHRIRNQNQNWSWNWNHRIQNRKLNWNRIQNQGQNRDWNWNHNQNKGWNWDWSWNYQKRNPIKMCMFQE